MPSAEWLYEQGIGENRAILTINGAIVEARIERHGMIQAGLVAVARLVKQLVPGKRGIAILPDGRENIACAFAERGDRRGRRNGGNPAGSDRRADAR